MQTNTTLKPNCIKVLFDLILWIAGYSLFLAFVIDRLHHYIRELRSLRKSMDVATKLNRALEEAKSGSSESHEKEINGLKEDLEKLKSELHAKEEEVKSAEANSLALRKQSEGLLLEYDRLLEDNQHLRSQLQSIDLKLSHSDNNKKDT
jgi:B-cell receptor-associated protein 31